jgi:hypothetical protein
MLKGLFAVAAAAVFCARLCAQTTTIQGSIVGTVTDATGSAVPNATIEVVNALTNIKEKAVTNENGFYRVERLFRGSYTVSIEHPNFKRYVREQIKLVSGSRKIEGVN